MEIEKKYLIKSIPDNLDNYRHYDIEQAYISASPAIRVRKKGVYLDGTLSPTYILTVKGKGLIKREEFELTLEKKEYDNLLKKAEGNVITKCRYLIPLTEGLSLELDIFQGIFKGLVMGEIEFPDEDSAKKYNPPAFIGREVTFDERFHNSVMSTMSEADISDLLALMNECN
ncbi:MAG: CYTH domain-containing protein [Lachnospiraceae bacterium]|nr:CYTH domain-containing protein [Lachnospiraceae bacterium]